MTESAVPESSRPVIRVRPPDAFVRLTPFGWTGGIVFMVLLLATSFILAGYFLVYWRNADMDFMIVYRALLLNDNQFAAFEHPAYFTILDVKAWFQILHFFQLLDTSSLSKMPAVIDRPAFDAAMTNVIRAARLTSWMTATVFVLVFAGLARLLARDWRVALFAVYAFAFSGGLQFHLRILRSELVAACLVTFALMILMVAARRGTNWRPLAIGGAAALCVLGLENKIQAILSIAVLPLLIQPFGGPSSGSTIFWGNNWRAWLATLAAALAAGLLVRAALPIIAVGLDPTATMPTLHPLLFRKFGAYQAGLLALVGLGMLAFAVIWRVCLTETLAAMFAVSAGVSLSLMALLIEYNSHTIIVVLNPLEGMMEFADQSARSAIDSGSLFSAFALFLSGVGSVLQRYTFILFPSPRPAMFLTGLILTGIVYAWRQGGPQVAVQAALLMLCAVAIDSLGVRRGLKAEYFIFTDPLIIIAGLILLDRFNDLRFHKLAYPIGAFLIGLHIIGSQAEPIKLLTARKGPEQVCEWNQHYLPLLPMPWCDLLA